MILERHGIDTPRFDAPFVQPTRVIEKDGVVSDVFEVNLEIRVDDLGEGGDE